MPPLVGWAAATGNLDAAGAAPLPDRLLLDAAALLGARAADQARLRGGEGSRCCRSCAASDETARQIVWYSLVLVAVTLLPFAWHTARRRSTSPPRSLLGALFLASRGGCGARRRTARARRALPLLAPLPRAALRGARGGPADRDEPTPSSSARTASAWALFGLFLLLFGGTVVIALVYLALLGCRAVGPARLLALRLRRFVLSRRSPPPAAMRFAPVSSALDPARGDLPRPAGAAAARDPRSRSRTCSTRPGLVTTYGSILFADHVPTRDARRRCGGSRPAGYVERRQDEPARVRLRDDLREPALRDGAEPAAPPGRVAGGSSGGSAAALAAGLADAALGTRLRRLDPDPRRLLRRRRLQADATGSCRSTAASRSRRASTTRGRWRATSPAARGCWRRSRPGFEPGGARARRTSRSASPGPSSPTRWCARASRPPPSCSRGGAGSSCRSRSDFYAVFSREVADVHRELFAEHADSYGENVRPKIERCLARHRRRVRARAASSGSATASSSPRPQRRSTSCSRRPSPASRRRRRPDELALRGR